MIADLNPLRVERFGMSPETLLVAKLSWVLLLVGGFLGHAGQPYVPALDWLDALRAVPGYAWVLPLLFLGAGAALLMNRSVRVAAIVAGGCVLLAQAQSLAAWRSHEWISASLLVLAGLHAPGERPWLLRARVSLGLVAVLFDHPTAVDWSTKIELEGWIGEQGTEPTLAVLRQILPDSVLYLLTGWIVPAIATSVAIGVWVPRVRMRAIWVGCTLQVGTYVLIGSKDAALDSMAMLIGFLAFLNWPRESLAAHWPRACGWPMWLRIALDRHDADRRIEWPFPENPDADLDVWVDGRHSTHRKAISALLLYFPLFHILIFVAAIMIHLLLPEPWSMLAHACMGLWLLVFFALPTFARVSRRWRR